jgi:hypothetical protein
MLDKKAFSTIFVKNEEKEYMASSNSAIGFSRVFYILAHIFLGLGILFLFFAIYLYSVSDNDINMFYGLINLVIGLLIYILLDRVAKLHVDHHFRDLNSPHQLDIDDDES